MMSDAMGALDLDTTIRVNDRRILDGLAKRCGITEAKEFYRMIGIIDKIDKIGSYAVVNEIEAAFGSTAAEVVHTYTSFNGDTAGKIDAASDLLTNEEGQQGLENISKIMGTLVTAGYSEKSIIFDATIARGLDYYTGTIYETMLNRLPSIGSVCSGGRFDNLIQDMGGPATPAVGTALGVDRLLEGMRQLGTLKPVKTNTTVFMTNIDTTMDAERFAIVQDLRKQGIATELILGPQKFGKQLRDIDGLGVRYALLYGSNEAETQTVIVKDLQSGEQTPVAVTDLANYFKAIKGE
jgi:histidyl-tRNA synthetase